MDHVGYPARAVRPRASFLLTVGGQIGSGAYANWIGRAYPFPTADVSETIGTWRMASTGRLPSARAGLGAFEWHGRIYAIGGTDAGGGFLPDVLSAEYDPGAP